MALEQVLNDTNVLLEANVLIRDKRWEFQGEKIGGAEMKRDGIRLFLRCMAHRDNKDKHTS
jgi:hypothetical protein